MLSVIVPATDAPGTLPACTRAIRAALPDGAELIVQTERAAASGPAAARNAAAARARGDVLVFVDSDVVVHPDALPRIAARFAGEPELDALFGCYDPEPEARGTVSRFRNLLHHHVHVSSAGAAETFWAGLGAVRRSAFEDAGGFDERRYARPAIEDIELGVRLRSRGSRVELDPAIQGTHLKAWTLRSMVATDFSRRGVPWVRLQLERREPATALNLQPRQRFAAAAACLSVVALARGRPALALAAAAAMVAANRSFYGLLARRGGLRLALAGVPLHALHHLTAVASVPGGALAHLAAARGGRGNR